MPSAFEFFRNNSHKPIELFYELLVMNDTP